MLNRADYNFVVKYGEVSPDGVAVYDLNSRTFVYVNRFLRGMLDLPPQGDVTSAQVMNLVHPADAEYTDHLYRELLSIGCIAPAEFRVKTGNGNERTLNCEVLWLEESYTFALFVKDVTSARTHDNYVVKISAQKDMLLDTLLHNLGGPLYLTKDVLGLLEKDGAANAESARLLSIVRRSTARCIEIIQQYLEREHRESLGVDIKISRFDIAEKTAIVTDLLRALSQDKKIAVSMSLEDPFVSSDPVKYCQIIQNLLSNAVKFTAADGSIELSVDERESMIVVTVRDNGVGVPSAIISDLFQKKVQPRPGENGEQGRGVGLLLCGELARIIGGNLTYRPAPGRGSEFLLTFPKLQPLL